MNATGSHKIQREVLRLRLQVHREQMALKYKRRPAGSNNPRSLTMRLLTRQPHLGLWVLAEFLPVLLRHFLNAYSRDATVNEEDDEDEEDFLPATRHNKRITRQSTIKKGTAAC